MKAKRLKRTKVKGQQGSRYAVTSIRIVATSRIPAPYNRCGTLRRASTRQNPERNPLGVLSFAVSDF